MNLWKWFKDFLNGPTFARRQGYDEGYKDAKEHHSIFGHFRGDELTFKYRGKLDDNDGIFKRDEKGRIESLSPLPNKIRAYPVDHTTSVSVDKNHQVQIKPKRSSTKKSVAPKTKTTTKLKKRK